MEPKDPTPAAITRAVREPGETDLRYYARLFQAEFSNQVKNGISDREINFLARQTELTGNPAAIADNLKAWGHFFELSPFVVRMFIQSLNLPS